MKYSAIIEGKNYEFEEQDILDMDLVSGHENIQHFLDGNHSYNARLLKLDYASKIMILEINHRKIQVRISEPLDQLIDKMGLTKVLDSGQKEIKAPMPGLILGVLVKEGDAVTKDQDLIILEAMKMENILKAEGDAVVEKICIKKGDSVEKHQVLIELQ